MAINRGVLGSQTGSMGGITASNWKGKNVYKQKVPATNSSATPLQVRRRRMFALLALWSRVLGPGIRVGYKQQAVGVTEQNVFMTRNYSLINYSGTTATLDPARIQISAGTVTPLFQPSKLYDSASGLLSIGWIDNSNGVDALPTDIVCIVVANTTAGTVAVNLNAGARINSQASVQVPLNAQGIGDDLHVYIFMKRANSFDCSPTTHLVVAI